MVCPKGFSGLTLVETLIIIGIIGVIAALLMPSIIAKYKHKVLDSQNKKSQSIIANGIRMLMAKDEVNELKNSSLMSCSTKECVKQQMHKAFKIAVGSGDNSFLSIAPEEYKFTDDDKDVWFDNEDLIYSFVTTDGAIYGIEKFSDDASSINFIADINGSKGPNEGAEDLCMFTVTNNGIIKDYCSDMVSVETPEEDTPVTKPENPDDTQDKPAENPQDNTPDKEQDNTQQNQPDEETEEEQEETPEDNSCAAPDDYWDNCQTGFKWLDIKYGHVCAKCKSGYKVEKVSGKLIAGYCKPKSCK